MKLVSLDVKNFRALDSVKIDFDPKVTVIVGRNGAGKTSILDAIKGMLPPIRMLWPNSDGNVQIRKISISNEDIRYGAEECYINLKYALADPSRNVSVEDEVSFSTSDKKRGNAAENRLRQNTLSPNYTVPQKTLLIYYHQDRGFSSRGKSDDVFNSDVVQNTSLQADLRAINDLELWWDKLDAQEARTVRDDNRNYRNPELEAVRKLIQAIDNFSDISYSSTEKPGLYFTKNDGAKIHVSKISSGERSYVILLADLARRLQVISPDTALQEIPGVVLIDEIELNLHPAWQSEIVSTLCNTFKACQFIITTHSPQVISSASSRNVRILDRTIEGKTTIDTPLSTKGRTSNYLLEGIFGASERFPPLDRKVEEFNDAIDRKDPASAKKIFNELSNSIEGQPPELVVLKKRLSKLEGQS
jgi:predicted ATP-binding protein involved in virulence